MRTQDTGPSAPVRVAAVEVRGVSKSFDGLTVLQPVSLSVANGEFLALLGGSGCGKTTLLRIIAGLEYPDDGAVLIGGTDVTALPPYQRPVNMMFQSYAVFPHLTVGDNIAYGLRAAGVPRAERDELVGWALKLVRLEQFGRRRPHQLSGGQRQRVALARCLVKKPAVLLLDEPMAALDRGLRDEMQRELVRIQRDVGTTFILVTHDQDEAMSMADRVAVMEGGRIVQCGPPHEIYERPVNRFVARFVGRVNLMDGHVAEVGPGTVDVDCGGSLRVHAHSDAIWALGTPCSVAIRPERVAVSREPTGLAHDLSGTVQGLAYFGDSTRAEIRLLSGAVFEATVVDQVHGRSEALRPGDTVHIGFDRSAAVVLAA